MDIIRITMNGYGCELNRGIVPDGNEKKIEESLDNIWFKNIFNKLEQKTKIKKAVKERGLLNGEVKITVNDEIIIDTNIRCFEALINSNREEVKYPKNQGIVLTSIQHQEGVFLDTIFVLNDTFDLNKLSITKKDIKDRVDNTLVGSLYCELYYDGYIIPVTDNFTDLRMSRLFFEKPNKNV